MAGVDLGVLDRELFLRFLVAGFLLGVGRVVRRGRRRPLERVLEDSCAGQPSPSRHGQQGGHARRTLGPSGIVSRRGVRRMGRVFDGRHDECRKTPFPGAGR